MPSTDPDPAAAFEIPPDAPIAIIGLGYVGLPLAAEFARHRPVIGFDIDPERIAELRDGHDRTLEVEPHELERATHLAFSSDPEALRPCRVFVVTVPTPITVHKQPDLTPLIRASETIGRAMAPGSLVIYESTVYPGATEEICVPVLERESRLAYNGPDGTGFFCGYSPERINPGDRAHRVADIVKVTAGSTPAVGAAVDALYSSVITAGTHLASSIRVAEAAKVIENTQRDLNIALVNELAIIFDRLGIDTLEVLEAAGTKWNFLPFRPGLVGGHCIGVDPYYLTHKAQEVGHHPELILAGRRINDRMGMYVANLTVKAMLSGGIALKSSRVLVLGLTFKENCPDLRNTRVVDLVGELKAYGCEVVVHDPWANAEEALHECDIELEDAPAKGTFDAVILAVPHEDFKRQGSEKLREWGAEQHIFFDLKSAFPEAESDVRL